jgi:hypothetical protein
MSQDEEYNVFAPQGTQFFHGSPYLFDEMADNPFFSNEPAIALAILTEKCDKYGYFYIFENTEDLILKERGSDITPVSIWCNQPCDVDYKVANNQSIDYAVITTTNNGYLEFLYDRKYKFLLKRIYKINVEKLRERVTEIVFDSVLTFKDELQLVNEFIPCVGQITHDLYPD